MGSAWKALETFQAARPTQTQTCQAAERPILTRSEGASNRAWCQAC
jgi:hypothetical protein